MLPSCSSNTRLQKLFLHRFQVIGVNLAGNTNNFVPMLVPCKYLDYLILPPRAYPDEKGLIKSINKEKSTILVQSMGHYISIKSRHCHVLQFAFAVIARIHQSASYCLVSNSKGHGKMCSTTGKG